MASFGILSVTPEPSILVSLIPNGDKPRMTMGTRRPSSLKGAPRCTSPFTDSIFMLVGKGIVRARIRLQRPCVVLEYRVEVVIDLGGIQVLGSSAIF